MSRGDLEWLIEHSHPDIEMRMRGVAGESVRYAGADGIREYFRDMAQIWESVTYEAEEIHDLDDRLFAVVDCAAARAEWRSTATRDNRGALSAGEIIELRSYLNLAERAGGRRDRRVVAGLSAGPTARSRAPRRRGSPR